LKKEEAVDRLSGTGGFYPHYHNQRSEKKKQGRGVETLDGKKKVKKKNQGNGYY